MIHTSLSPNAETNDIRLALSLLLRPWTWRKDAVVRRFEKKLAETIGVSYVTAVDSGRTAFYTILKALDIGAGNEVIIQAYTCVAVPDPILWVGATPIYVDCTDDLVMDVEDLEKKISPRTKAIVVQHTFGIPTDMPGILAIARAHSTFVIEDCAHALGGSSGGVQLGSLADAAFFSFGRDKCISSVFGGAIATNADRLSSTVRSIVGSYPFPSPVWVARQLLHPVILALAKSTYNVFDIGKIILGLARKLHIISRAVEPKELRGEMPSFVKRRYSAALAALALHQMEKLPRYAEHRRKCARIYTEKLKGAASVRLPTDDPCHAYLRYTIFLNDPSRVIAAARRDGVELGDWYASVLAPPGVCYDAVGYTAGSCPNAERLAARSLNLPTHIGITPDMIEKIIPYVLV